MFDLLILVVLFFSITLHEFAHGYVAFIYGDQTARNQGRLTLNPLKHIDPFGTILLPLLLYFSGAPLIGWAKPVPINPYNFSEPKKGLLLCSLAGPLTNFSLALILTVLHRVFHLVSWLDYLLINGIYINLILGLFNLIPIPPLDGSRLISYFLKGRAAARFNQIEPYGILIIIALFYLGFFNFVVKLFNPIIKIFLQ